MRSQTRFHPKSRLLSALLCSAAVALLHGCAVTPSPTNTTSSASAAPDVKAVASLPAEVWVKQRSEARWKLMLAGKFFDAYQFLAPALKQVTSVDTYAKGFGPASLWLSTETKSVECTSAERCLVIVEVEARVASPSMRNKPTKGQVPEVWIFEDGNWWHFDK